MITHANVRYQVERSPTSANLVVEAPETGLLEPLEGTAVAHGDGYRLEGPLSSANAEVLRDRLPWLLPQPHGLATSAGLGDRLGLATPGHVRAFRSFGSGISPIFAQQSIREMERTGRTPIGVLNDATFGCVEAGWTDQVSADADHLKTKENIDRCIEAGFAFFTLDPGDYVGEVPTRITEESLASLPWTELEDDLPSFERRYRDAAVDLGEWKLPLDPAALRRAAVKYAPAVAVAVELYRHLITHVDRPIDVEVSVDETSEPTTLIEHAYMVLEMRRLGVDFVSYAPRYSGRFEKGVDYIGDPEAFAKDFARHANLARALGPYKLSLHSGSDKFSIYDAAQEATEGLVHLKTAGTSYLEALGVAAYEDPPLFREMYAKSLAAYREARASYHVSARYEAAPQHDQVCDDELAVLLQQHDSRQILHVGFGAILQAKVEEDGSTSPNPLGERLREVLLSEPEAFGRRLEQHLGRHLAPFSTRSSA